ncbi:FAD-binding oxidoreductase [Synechococcus sp. MIT S9452]|uniref:FAD-binding oxidoreductase n=1 Tax=Synechococcus sp. MIT S9452 TaxID=3082546 RepID=UPI0039A71A7B
MPDQAPLLTPERHELVELVRELHSQASPWIPSGLGNHLHWGPQPQLQSSVLSLHHHNQVLEHATGDFTVTVEAGMALGELQAVLAEQGQWLPIDPPLAGPSSIGGVVARGVSGPLRHKAMGLKDQVIGISLLRSDGTTARAGGQVVKNVAGYDLMRLLTGSWGSLALITQLTLRTQPLPSHRKCFAMQGSLPALQQLRQELLLHSPLALERLEWKHQAGEISLWLSLVSLNPEGLQQQQEQLKASVASELNLQAQDWEPSPEVVEQGSWLLRIGVEPQRSDVLLGLAAIKPWTLQLGAASGLGLATGQAASHQVANLRQQCESLGGYLTVLQAPPDQQIQAWGNAPARPIIEAVKRQFDPLQQLSRGRLPGVQAALTT